MKKYIKPMAEWDEVATEELLAYSTAVEEGFNLNELNETSDTSGNLSRHSNSLWDDDDDF